jgi:hypothetical protein
MLRRSKISIAGVREYAGDDAEIRASSSPVSGNKPIRLIRHYPQLDLVTMALYWHPAYTDRVENCLKMDGLGHSASPESTQFDCGPCAKLADYNHK